MEAFDVSVEMTDEEDGLAVYMSTMINMQRLSQIKID
jgi:hypothetical protein